MLPLIYGDSITNDDHFAIGSSFSSYRITEDGSLTASDYTSYPLFRNDHIVGIIDVTTDDNGAVSQVALGVDSAPELQEVLSEDNIQPFAIIYAHDGLYIKFSGDDDIVCLKPYMDYAARALNNTNFVLNNEIHYTIPSPAFDITYAKPMASYPIIETLDIQKVDNTSTDCCPDGICWAASIAMIANALTNTSYTALEVHDICGCLHEHSNYHSAEMDYIEQLEMTASGPFYYDIFNIDNTVDCIDSGKYMLLDLQDYGAAVAHNVLAYGYSISSNDSNYFYYMDPNTGGRLCSFPSTPGISVSVPLSGYDYLVHCYIAAY